MVTYIDVMRKLQFYLKTSHIRQLKAVAKLTGAPMAELVRRAVDEFLERRKAAEGDSRHGEKAEHES